MKSKNTQNQTNIQVRRMHERLGALVLILGTLAGTAMVSQETRRVLSGLTLRPAFAVLEHMSKENETARHPVRLDSVLRAQSIGGR